VRMRGLHTNTRLHVHDPCRGILLAIEIGDLRFRTHPTLTGLWCNVGERQILVCLSPSALWQHSICFARSDAR
jgi:hypothetical protein